MRRPVMPTMMHESAAAASSPHAQVRRAWVIVIACFAAFVTLSTVAINTGAWVYRHATAPETASLTVVSGSGVLVRSPSDPDWRLVEAPGTLREGDRISTALGTVAVIRTFDGSTVEVAEDTVVRLARMRSSRFLDRTKLNMFEVERGAIYVSMASRGEFTYSEVVVVTPALRVVMPDERGQDGFGAFLVEVTDDPASGHRDEARIGVLHGMVWLEINGSRTALTANQQVIVDGAGTIGPVTPIVRELVRNGTFVSGFEGWVPFIQRGPTVPEGSPTNASVELVPEATEYGPAVAVELLRRSGSTGPVSTGIRQRIGKTIRVHSSLRLQIDAKISDQHPPSSGSNLNEFPLMIEINYIDINGQEARWTSGYYVLADESTPIPHNRATKLDRDAWQRIVFDLRFLSPLPQQVTSIVVYASGQSYQTRIANISLSSGELIESAE
jgi:hypothetical protein